MKRPGGTLRTDMQRRRFTVNEYYRMADAGILDEDDRVELLDGGTYEMSPIGSRHAACVNRTASVFHSRLGDRAIVAVQNPLRLSARSEPEPDLVILRPRPDFYAAAHPGPADALLVIEVVDTSSRRDRSLKLPLYALAAVPEVWLAMLTSEQLLVRRNPSQAGYQDVAVYRRGDVVRPLTFPDLAIGVDDIVG